MDVLTVYAKPPEPGRTKSRLAMDIGDEPAAALAAALLRDLLREAMQVEQCCVQLWTPPEADAAAFDGLLPAHVEVRRQEGPDLGERMKHTFRRLLEGEGAARVLLAGSDCATFTAMRFREALGLLGHVDVVLQPVTDGGYVLVGQSSYTPAMFDEVDWGTDRVLRQTWRRLETTRAVCGELPPTFDIDDATALPALRDFLAHHDRPATQAWFETYAAELSRYVSLDDEAAG